MEQELAYSFHLGSDKNKSKVAKKTAKGNVSGTTSLSNNAIQNANDLSRANKHNLRDYDNQRELITTIYGTNDIVEDVKQVYIDEFEGEKLYDYEGLNYFQTSIYPHYNQDLIKEIEEVSKKEPILAIPDGSFIRIENEKIEYIGKKYYYK